MQFSKKRTFIHIAASTVAILAAFFFVASYAVAQDDASTTAPMVDPDTSSKIDNLKHLEPTGSDKTT